MPRRHFTTRMLWKKALQLKRIIVLEVVLTRRRAASRLALSSLVPSDFLRSFATGSIQCNLYLQWVTDQTVAVV